MTASRLVMVRHGQTNYNYTFLIQGGSNIELNQRGLEQAADAGVALKSYLADHRVTTFVASDLERAAQTAQIIGEELGLSQELTYNSLLRERVYGPYEGKDVAIYHRHRAIALETGTKMEGVESRTLVAARMAEAIKPLLAAGEEGDTVLVVSHGTSIVTLTVQMIGLDPHSARVLRGLDNCHWVELGYVGSLTPTGWQIRAYNVGV